MTITNVQVALGANHDQNNNKLEYIIKVKLSTTGLTDATCYYTLTNTGTGIAVTRSTTIAPSNNTLQTDWTTLNLTGINPNAHDINAEIIKLVNQQVINSTDFRFQSPTTVVAGPDSALSSDSATSPPTPLPRGAPLPPLNQTTPITLDDNAQNVPLPKRKRSLSSESSSSEETETDSEEENDNLSQQPTVENSLSNAPRLDSHPVQPLLQKNRRQNNAPAAPAVAEQQRRDLITHEVKELYPRNQSADDRRALKIKQTPHQTTYKIYNAAPIGTEGVPPHGHRGKPEKKIITSDNRITVKRENQAYTKKDFIDMLKIAQAAYAAGGITSLSFSNLTERTRETALEAVREFINTMQATTPPTPVPQYLRDLNNNLAQEITQTQNKREALEANVLPEPPERNLLQQIWQTKLR